MVSLTVHSAPCAPEGTEVDGAAMPGGVAATDLSEGAAANVLADSLSFWSAEAPATGFPAGLVPAAMTAGLSDGIAPAAVCGRVAEISSRKGAEKAATKAASEGTEDARDQRLG